MAGIYLHIPFCKQKCHYCNFYALASSKYRNEFVDALVKEINSRIDYLKGELINTIYFGGGTPSLLYPKEIVQIINTIKQNYNAAANPEITLEANPDDLSIDKLLSLKNDTPVNRLSIGIQSFFDDDLKYLNRVHNSLQAINSIQIAKETGFDNITIDLIYGIPTLTNEKWKHNLNRFFSFELPHLSSYSLTVEPKTPLKVLIDKGKIQPVEEEQSISHFEILLEETKRHNYIHYEISNFAKEGHYSKHNSIYWTGGHYIGFGPSAHSFNGESRQWNVSNMKQYMEAEMVEKIIEEKEILTINQQYNEYVMTSIRTSWGCDVEHIHNEFGLNYVTYFKRSIKPFLKQGKVKYQKSKYLLTNKGKLFADAIASDLFIS